MSAILITLALLAVGVVTYFLGYDDGKEDGYLEGKEDGITEQKKKCIPYGEEGFNAH